MITDSSNVEAQRLQAENDDLREKFSNMKIDHNHLLKQHQKQQAHIVKLGRNNQRGDEAQQDELIEALHEALQQECTRCAAVEQRLSRWESLGSTDQSHNAQLEQALALECAWSQALKHGLQAMGKEPLSLLYPKVVSMHQIEVGSSMPPKEDQGSHGTVSGGDHNWHLMRDLRDSGKGNSWDDPGLEQVESEVDNLRQSIQHGDDESRGVKQLENNPRRALQHRGECTRYAQQVHGLDGQVQNLATLMSNSSVWCKEFSEATEGPSADLLCDKLDHLSGNLTIARETFAHKRDRELVGLTAALHEKDDRIDQLEQEHRCLAMHFRMLASIDNELLCYGVSGALVKVAEERGGQC